MDPLAGSVLSLTYFVHLVMHQFFRPSDLLADSATLACFWFDSTPFSFGRRPGSHGHSHPNADHQIAPEHLQVGKFADPAAGETDAVATTEAQSGPWSLELAPLHPHVLQGRGPPAPGHCVRGPVCAELGLGWVWVKKTSQIPGDFL